MTWLSSFDWPGWAGLMEILILTFFFYFIFLLFRETPGAQVLTGLVFLLVILIGLTQVFRMDALNWLLRRLSVYLAIGLLILFQPEIRRALAELGRQHVFPMAGESQRLVDDIVEAIMLLAGNRIGALVAVEREIGTRAVQDTGVRLDCRVTPELLASIFYPRTPLHDGGVIICGDRIVAAGCVFPLSQKEEMGKGFGTRHRAALGLTEETDAVVIVVSEETGAVSLSFRGSLTEGLDEQKLRSALGDVLVREVPRDSVGTRWRRARKQLDLALHRLWGTGQTEERNQDYV